MRAASPRSAGFAQRSLGSVVLAVAAAFALTGLCSIWIWRLRWPAADLWRQYVTLLGLPFPDNVLALENGHRPVLPNAVRVFDAWCCGASQAGTTAVALLLSAASFAILLGATWRDERISFVQRAAVAFFAALATYWLVNGRMLVQTSEMLNVQFALLALLLGVVAVYRAANAGPMTWCALAAACATAAAFTFGPGIAAFPALLAVAIAVRVPWRGIALLAFALPVVLWLYLFVLPGDDGVRGNVVIDPATNLRHALQWLGAPLFVAWLGLTDPVAEASVRNAMSYSWGGVALVQSAQAIAARLPAYGGWWSSSAITGAIGLLSAIAVGVGALRRKPGTVLAAIGLALASFGAGVAFVIALGRHDLFVEAPGQIFADRYLPWSCLFWLGIAIAAVRALPARWAWTSGLLALAVAVLAFPVHAVQAGWADSFALLAERGAVALRLGIWDETVMPWTNEASREQVGQTMAYLRERDALIWAGLPDRSRTMPPGHVDTAAASALVVTRRFADAETGRDVIAFEGRTSWPQRTGELLVVDAEGRFRGLGLLEGRHDWRDLIRPGATDVGVYGYAFAGDCAALYATVLRDGIAQAIARLDPCTPPMP